MKLIFKLPALLAVLGLGAGFISDNHKLSFFAGGLGAGAALQIWITVTYIEHLNRRDGV